jgi:hypothetical protein
MVGKVRGGQRDWWRVCSGCVENVNLRSLTLRELLNGLNYLSKLATHEFRRELKTEEKNNTVLKLDCNDRDYELSLRR